MRKLVIIATVLVSGSASAQVQMGTGIYGGVCMGIYCPSSQPAPNTGYGINNGACFGANCYREEEPRRPSYQQEHTGRNSFGQPCEPFETGGGCGY